MCPLILSHRACNLLQSEFASFRESIRASPLWERPFKTFFAQEQEACNEPSFSAVALTSGLVLNWPDLRELAPESRTSGQTRSIDAPQSARIDWAML